MDWETLYPGRFTKKEVLERPKVIRITGVNVTDLETDRGKEPKVVLEYRDAQGKGEIVWCKTNSALTSMALNERHYDKWIGRLITIYHDPRVTFGKKVLGGIRVFGSPEMAKAIKVELKPPRKKNPRPEDIHTLVPTDNQGNPKQATKQAAPPVDEPPPVDDTNEPEPPISSDESEASVNV